MASPSPTRVPVWLDCDPGHDDAFAILLAGYSSRVRLIGISTVHGNCGVERSTANALDICNVAGLGYLPVVQGAGKPLLRPSKACPEIHGESGLETKDGFKFPALPAERKPVAAKAANYTYHCLRNHVAAHPGEKVTIVATGPLTNIALLLSVYPEVREEVESIVWLGGACGRGNMPVPVAEWNAWTDPEAVALVFNQAGEPGGIPVTMVPIDVTHTVLVTSDVLKCVALGGVDVSCPPHLPGLAGTDAAGSRTGSTPIKGVSSAASGAAAAPTGPPRSPAAAVMDAVASAAALSAASPAAAGGAAASSSAAAFASADAAPASSPSKAPPAFDFAAAHAAAITPFRRLLVSLLGYFSESYDKTFGMPQPPLHDPLAVLYALDRGLFITRKCRVDVETANPLSLGQTIADLINIGGHPEERKNVTVATGVHVSAFWRHMLEAITSADQRSCLNPPQSVYASLATAAAAGGLIGPYTRFGSSLSPLKATAGISAAVAAAGPSVRADVAAATFAALTAATAASAPPSGLSAAAAAKYLAFAASLPPLGTGYGGLNATPGYGTVTSTPGSVFAGMGSGSAAAPAATASAAPAGSASAAAAAIEAAAPPSAPVLSDPPAPAAAATAAPAVGGGAVPVSGARAAEHAAVGAAALATTH